MQLIFKMVEIADRLDAKAIGKKGEVQDATIHCDSSNPGGRFLSRAGRLFCASSTAVEAGLAFL
jgi:hypothetical protein